MNLQKLLLAIAFLMMLCMSFTLIVSRQTRKINRLVQQVAILEKELVGENGRGE